MCLNISGKQLISSPPQTVRHSTVVRSSTAAIPSSLLGLGWHAPQ